MKLGINTTGYIDYNNFTPEQIANFIIEKLNNSINIVDNNYLNIKFKNIISNILLDEIFYIESVSPLIYIHTTNNKFKTYLKLSSILPLLPDNFIRTHYSYVVNRNHIQYISSTKITLVNGESVPISRTFKKMLKKNSNKIF